MPARTALGLAAALALATGASAAGAKASLPAGIDTTAFDTATPACNDFFQHACGGWLAKNPIPADQSTWGRFHELAERNRDTLKSILEAAAPDDPKRSANDRMIGDYYASCLDEAAIEKKGLAPLQPELDAIAALKTKADLPALVARLHADGVGVFFGFGSLPDLKDASQVRAIADQGGLGLPDRDYYLKDDPKSVETRQKYLAHVQRTLELLGDPKEQAAQGATDVMAIETALAKAAMDRVLRRDPNNLYNMKTRTELVSLNPGFGWEAYLAKVGAPSFQKINVTNPPFFAGLETVLAGTDLPRLKTYLRWQVAHEASPLLGKAFVDENFAFYGKVVTGAQELRPRWKRCVDRTDEQLGEALGRAYVERTFGEEGRRRMSEMVAGLEQSVAANIGELSWMGDATKQAALGKLKAMANRIGHPDKWRDYSSVRVERGDALGNARRASAFEFARDLAKIDQPVDTSEWPYTPATVNAGYNPLLNNITFPAGILQPPFFDRTRDDAANYGGIGAVIGHELTHGFDDQGRKFAADGNLTDWWTAADDKAFSERAACIEKQYGEYTAVDELKLNGKLTLGENVADNGGVRVAYRALMQTLATQGGADTKLDGFTPAQRFFLGYAQIWCGAWRPEAARMRTQVDPHSPPKARVNGVLSNSPEFAAAFSCKAGDPMVRKDACRVW